MKISFNLNYHTQWGEALYICGDLIQLGGGDAREAIEMKLMAPDTWVAELDVDGYVGDFNYFFVVKAPENLGVLSGASRIVSLVTVNLLK